jgi:hypothetical protein
MAGRAGTGTAGRRVRVDEFFSKLYPTRFIPVPVSGTRVSRARVRGTGTRVFFLCFYFCFFAGTRIDLMWTEGGKFLKFEFHGSTGTQGRGRGRTTGKQVRVQRGFSKKRVTGPSQTRTRLPAYTRSRVRVPGTSTGCTRRVLANH